MLLPDIESTNQALNLLKNAGIISSYSQLPEVMRLGIRDFTVSLLSGDDGYVYHPQWGKSINSARRGRDLMWATHIASKLDFKFPYPTALERINTSLKDDAGSYREMPEHLRSEKAFLKYLSEMDFYTSPNPYKNGNTLAAQVSQIVAAGLGEVAVNYLNSVQNKETGFWGYTCKTPYDYINGLLKISSVYSAAGATIPNAARAASSVIDCMTYPLAPDTPCFTACWQYNCWSALFNLIDNLNEHGGAKGAEEVRRLTRVLLLRCDEALRSTKEKLEIFKKPDGAFSMLPGNSACTSQCQPVAIPNTAESDLNASVICTSGLYNRMCSLLGINSLAPSICSPEGFEDFLRSAGF